MSSNREESIRRLLAKDLLACEFKISLFAGALQTYRQDHCLRPFPQFCIKSDGSRDSEALKTRFGKIPPLRTILKDISKLSEDEIQLVEFILGEKVYQAVSCTRVVIDEIRSIVGGFGFDVRPDYVFEIQYSKGSTNQSKFDELAGQYPVKYGFHGSRHDNFYSIVNNGLQRHMTKNAMFGDGIYLSEDLSVTMLYAVNGQTWKHSVFGDSVSCVAVCEILDHPDVKCQVKSTTGPGSNRSRAHAEGSQAGEVPEKYFVVTNSELVRIKYVFMFASKKTPKRPTNQQWVIQRYPVATVLILYAFFLLLMGLWRTKQVQMFYKRYWVNRYSDVT